jgi:ATP-binding cassette subfamily B multidrug efflux pump
VEQGQVLVDGIDVREWDLESLRRHVGLVLQEPFLFTGSVRDNLAVDGAPAGDGARLATALAAAHATSVIDALPGGLDAPVRERGANLSQGQRQLLALARALIYNPRVLALDEATSSVDAESEALIRSAMRALLRGRASLVIAHRLSTVQSADRILVLHHGEIRETGSHAELVAAGGLYARLHEIQHGRGDA